ncbi:hypothetical protein CXG81DRAFT_23712 [Caulochytrium protostelioides]|uniref:Uncharacterized protein n=1 Tax=Caulochytrium protostelioides TaxID=1555241 RepID=A0A4V1IVC7_9FUNG|nr:hypothetical protein CXG81DRAFT_23712 [Caulochytrium protostelioides]|eukprot:RKP03599.1 hypothetical protein CXG81DRAFT_23712 [Caulochytrium protostelioides]
MGLVRHIAAVIVRNLDGPPPPLSPPHGSDRGHSDGGPEPPAPESPSDATFRQPLSQHTSKAVTALTAATDDDDSTASDPGVRLTSASVLGLDPLPPGPARPEPVAAVPSRPPPVGSASSDASDASDALADGPVRAAMSPSASILSSDRTPHQSRSPLSLLVDPATAVTATTTAPQPGRDARPSSLHGDDDGARTALPSPLASPLMAPRFATLPAARRRAVSVGVPALSDAATARPPAAGAATGLTGAAGGMVATRRSMRRTPQASPPPPWLTPHRSFTLTADGALRPLALLGPDAPHGLDRAHVLANLLGRQALPAAQHPYHVARLRERAHAAGQPGIAESDAWPCDAWFTVPEALTRWRPDSFCILFIPDSGDAAAAASGRDPTSCSRVAADGTRTGKTGTLILPPSLSATAHDEDWIARVHTLAAGARLPFEAVPPAMLGQGFANAATSPVVPHAWNPEYRFPRLEQTSWHFLSQPHVGLAIWIADPARQEWVCWTALQPVELQPIPFDTLAASVWSAAPVAGSQPGTSAATPPSTVPAPPQPLVPPSPSLPAAARRDVAATGMPMLPGKGPILIQCETHVTRRLIVQPFSPAHGVHPVTLVPGGGGSHSSSSNSGGSGGAHSMSGSAGRAAGYPSSLRAPLASPAVASYSFEQFAAILMMQVRLQRLAEAVQSQHARLGASPELAAYTRSLDQADAGHHHRHRLSRIRARIAETSSSLATEQETLAALHAALQDREAHLREQVAQHAVAQQTLAAQQAANARHAHGLRLLHRATLVQRYTAVLDLAVIYPLQPVPIAGLTDMNVAMARSLSPMRQPREPAASAVASLASASSASASASAAAAAAAAAIPVGPASLAALAAFDRMTLLQLPSTIRGLLLPDPRLHGHGATVGTMASHSLSTALGFTAHLVALMALFLDVPLRYPLRPAGAASTVFDGVTAYRVADTDPPGVQRAVISGRARGIAGRAYPLSAPADRAAVPLTRYALYLLNRNIEQLAHALGRRLPDLRQTLSNVALLMIYVREARDRLVDPDDDDD